MPVNLDSFAVFIISNGRPNNVRTWDLLDRCGYTGKRYIVIDNLDKTGPEYKNVYHDSVLVFDKEKIAATVDNGDNFHNLRTTTHARNACFELAEAHGIDFFLVLDDDYTAFEYRYNNELKYWPVRVKNNIDNIFLSAISFLNDSGIASLCFCQGGDFIGGSEHQNARAVKANRKAMNTFFFKTDRPVKFISRLNEDVNTVLSISTRGGVFLTTTQMTIVQLQTQSSSGGMTDAYLDHGTYVKSFYSVMYSPSSVKVAPMSGRMHHNIKWKNTVPLILSESVKKNA